MSRSRKSLRRGCLHQLIESLETRRLLSLVIDVQVDGIDPTTPVASQSASTVSDAHTINVTDTTHEVGTVYDLSIWAVTTGADSDSTNDQLDLLSGSLIASELRAIGRLTLSVTGTFSFSSRIKLTHNGQFQAGLGNHIPMVMAM